MNVRGLLLIGSESPRAGRDGRVPVSMSAKEKSKLFVHTLVF
jgi:hypothetical protein